MQKLMRALLSGWPPFIFSHSPPPPVFPLLFLYLSPFTSSLSSIFCIPSPVFGLLSSLSLPFSFKLRCIHELSAFIAHQRDAKDHEILAQHHQRSAKRHETLALRHRPHHITYDRKPPAISFHNHAVSRDRLDPVNPLPGRHQCRDIFINRHC